MKPSAAYVRRIYDTIHAASEPENAWDRHTSREIRRALSQWQERLDTPKTLNIGSGGLSYDLTHAIEVDFALPALTRSKRAVVGDAHNLPLRGRAAQAVICVGGVINYVSLPEAMSEISRVLEDGGLLVVEYERTRTLQFVGRDTFNRNVSPEPTTYRGGAHVLWRYSDEYVLGILRSCEFEVIDTIPFHILSPLLLRVHAPQLAVALIAKLDSVFRAVQSMTRLASNHLIVARRRYHSPDVVSTSSLSSESTGSRSPVITSHTGA